jgi:myo-inositol-1(or 4)-monophosphatase
MLSSAHPHSEPPDDVAYAQVDWSRYKDLPAFEQARRSIACGTCAAGAGGAEGRETMSDDPFLVVASRAARRAASVIEDAARDLKRLPAHATTQGEIVAAAAAEAENAIIATLRAAFPEHAIVGEESGGVLGEATAARPGACKWFVDPLDGSTNFRRGYPHYAISLALAQGARITHAAVFDPLRDELYTAVAGRGAALNGGELCVSACRELGDALIGTVSPIRSSARMAPYLAVFAAVDTGCGDVRRAGSCALDLCYVAAARLDGFFVMGLRNWHVAAGALIVEEAGGRVGDFAGGPDFLRTNEMIAAAPGVFNALREAIATAKR